MYIKSILIVNVDLTTVDLDVSELGETGAEVRMLNTFDEGIKAVLQSPYDVLIVDARLDSKTAFEFCRIAKATNPDVKLVLIVGEAEAAPVDLAVDFLIVRRSTAAKEEEKRNGSTE